jgi:hypothetical protein
MISLEENMKISEKRITEITPLLLKLEFPNNMGEIERKVVREFMSDLAKNSEVTEKDTKE